MYSGKDYSDEEIAVMNLISNAYDLSDPVPELLKLIKAHPTVCAAYTLASQYIITVEEAPYRGDTLASALAAVRDSPDAPTIEELSLRVHIYKKLAWNHSRDFGPCHDNPDEPFGPTNTYLLYSLACGLSLKYDLTSCSDLYQNIVRGLNAQDDSSSPWFEVIVTGTCIQLLINGSGIVPTSNGAYMKSADQVATKLKAQKSKGTVKNPHALHLLELAISHAETGFKKENDIDNVWELLFPQPRTTITASST